MRLVGSNRGEARQGNARIPKKVGGYMENVINIKENRKSIGERHIYTQEIMKLLRETEEGNIVNYSEIEDLIGLNPQAPGPGYRYQKSARDILERDESIVFEPVDTIGLRRMTAREVALSTAGIYLQRKKSIIKRSKRRIETVNDCFGELTPEAQTKTTFARTLIAFDSEMTKAKNVKLIETKVDELKQLVGFKSTIQLFSK
jgi:hypothetical protein